MSRQLANKFSISLLIFLYVLLLVIANKEHTSVTRTNPAAETTETAAETPKAATSMTIRTVKTATHYLIKSNKNNAHNEKVIIGNVTEHDDNTNNNNTAIIEDFIRKYPINLWKQHGFFREDYLKEFSIHWLKFSPPNKRNHVILAAIYVVIMLIGMFGNLLVIILFVRYVM